MQFQKNQWEIQEKKELQWNHKEGDISPQL